jgi:hypothetical protein
VIRDLTEQRRRLNQSRLDLHRLLEQRQRFAFTALNVRGGAGSVQRKGILWFCGEHRAERRCRLVGVSLL